MRTLACALVVGLCAGASLLLLTRWLRGHAPALTADLEHRLHRRGLRLFNLHAASGQLAVAWGAGHLLLVGVLAAAVLLISRNALVASVLAIAALATPAVRRSMRIRRRRRDIERNLPDALLFLSGALRAGSALPTAVAVFVREHKGALAQELDQLLAEQRLGVPFDEALMQAAARIALPDFTLFTVALRVSRDVGGNLADALRLLSHTLRRKLAMEGRILALTSQGRAQGIVMTLLPVVLGVVLYFVQPSMKLLVTTPIGWMVVGIAGLLLGLGYLTIRKIVAIEV